MNLCLLEVAMCEKCRSSHFQSERGVKSMRTGGEGGGRGGGGKKKLGLEGFLWLGSQYPITCHGFFK